MNENDVSILPSLDFIYFFFYLLLIEYTPASTDYNANCALAVAFIALSLSPRVGCQTL